MKIFYAKFIDKLLYPKLEKNFHLGRRHVKDRRLWNEDRRNNGSDEFQLSEIERRKIKTTRRSPGVEERRKRWFRINRFQSRHFSWSPDAE